MSSSILNSVTQVDTSTPIPSHISERQILDFLHDSTKMLALNPLVSEYKTLPAENSTIFYQSVPSKHKPADPLSCKTFFITEDSEAREASSGSWTKKFVPDKVQYETGMENTPSGATHITHAPLGVSSVTTWTVRQKGPGKACVVDMTGKVESNKILMQFIKKMLPEDYQGLAQRFLEALVKDVEGQEVAEKV